MAMLGKPNYGSVGWLAMPYFLIFEAIGPLIEVSGYVVTAVAVMFGRSTWSSPSCCSWPPSCWAR